MTSYLFRRRISWFFKHLHPLCRSTRIWRIGGFYGYVETARHPPVGSVLSSTPTEYCNFDEMYADI